MKRWNVTALSMGAILVLSGCGGNSSSSNSSSDVQTGTGYYVDNAVQGVEYVCGSKTGKTGTDGKFTFEEGKECNFTLAGIPLRTTKADELEDGKKVFENNPKVAKFLQSIDSDGDLSNGIQITKEVLTALTTALETSNSVGKLPEEAVLTEVVAGVGHDVESVSGDVRTDAQVEEHLTQTQTEATKELLAGKTFYEVIKSADFTNIIKIVFNQEVTLVKIYKLDGTFNNDININIVGDKLILESGLYKSISQNNDYLSAELHDADGAKNGISYRMYASQSDAQAYVDSLQSKKNPLSAESLKAYFSARTLYNINDKDTIETVVFNSDATTLQFGSDEVIEIVLKDGKMVDKKDGDHFIDEITDKYVKGHDSHGEFVFYVSRADAQIALDAQGNANNGTKSLESFIVGKTYYVTADSADVKNPHVETLQFSSDGHTVTDRWQENGETKTYSFTYSISNDTFNISGTGADGQAFSETFNAPVTETNEYISFSGHDGRFYKSYAIAEARLNNR